MHEFISERLNSDQLQALGRVVAEWSLLERELIRGISRIAFEDLGHANVFTSKFNIEALTNIYLSLLPEIGKQKSTIDKFKNIRKKIIKYNQTRNKFVHGLWVKNYVEEDTVGLVNFRKGNRLTISIEELKTKELNETAEAIDKLIRELMKFNDKYLASVKPICERLGYIEIKEVVKRELLRK